MSLLHHFLSNAPNLENLFLGAFSTLRIVGNRGYMFGSGRTTDITDIFATLTWPQLAHLGLWKCGTELNPFIQFIEQHATTLKCIHIQHIQLEASTKSLPGAWETAILQLTPKLKLRSMESYGRLTDKVGELRLEEGDINGLPAEFLIYSYFLELFTYALTGGGHRPAYGEPRSFLASFHLVSRVVRFPRIMRIMKCPEFRGLRLRVPTVGDDWIGLVMLEES